MSRRRLADAIWAALRYGLGFAGFDSELRPCVGLHPAISERLHRTPAQAPETIVPERASDGAWGLDDVIQMLVLCSEPRRLRTSDASLFAKAQEELEALLVPLPEWLTPNPSLDDRIHRARRWAVHHSFVQAVGEAGRTLRLEITEEGRNWLALQAPARAQEILKTMRFGPRRRPRRLRLSARACERPLLLARCRGCVPGTRRTGRSRHVPRLSGRARESVPQRPRPPFVWSACHERDARDGLG